MSWHLFRRNSKLSQKKIMSALANSKLKCSRLNCKRQLNFYDKCNVFLCFTSRYCTKAFPLSNKFSSREGMVLEMVKHGNSHKTSAMSARSVQNTAGRPLPWNLQAARQQLLECTKNIFL